MDIISVSTLTNKGVITDVVFSRPMGYPVYYVGEKYYHHKEPKVICKGLGHSILIPCVDIEEAVMIEMCNHFGCTCHKYKGEYFITTADPLNLFWLGANLVFDYKDNLSESVYSKIKRENGKGNI